MRKFFTVFCLVYAENMQYECKNIYLYMTILQSLELFVYSVFCIKQLESSSDICHPIFVIHVQVFVSSVPNLHTVESIALFIFLMRSSKKVQKSKECIQAEFINYSANTILVSVEFFR